MVVREESLISTYIIAIRWLNAV